MDTTVRIDKKTRKKLEILAILRGTSLKDIVSQLAQEEIDTLSVDDLEKLLDVRE